MQSPDEIAPPPELNDYRLLSLFQFQRTLEEIDQTDTGRLSRALEAGQIDRTWGKSRTEMSSSDWAKYQSTLVWFKREGKKLLDD